MRMKVLAAVSAAALMVAIAVPLSGGTASAAKPLDVDCDLLEATNDDVFDFLDQQGVQFNNLGDLYSSAIQDEAIFEQLSGLILLFSGGQIEFESASQAISTNGKCGLTKQLIDHIRD